MRGIRGSILGVPLQKPYLLGCINDRGELSQISYGQAHSQLGCSLMRVQDLPLRSGPRCLTGLPAGEPEQRDRQMRELAHKLAAALCTPPAETRPTPTAAPRGIRRSVQLDDLRRTNFRAADHAPPHRRRPSAAGIRATTIAAAVPQKPGTDCRTAA